MSGAAPPGCPPLAALSFLVCPRCRGRLAHRGPRLSHVLAQGRLLCQGCGALWPVEGALPRLMDPAPPAGALRLVQALYDRAPALYGPAEATLLPLLQQKTAAATREGWLPLLELEALTAAAGRPARILEVGVGAGANLGRMARRILPGVEAEVWGVDVSAGMLRHARRRLGRGAPLPCRLLLADAHALPFPDGLFDRVLTVGAANTFRDPPRALGELARVARPGAPVVVVDEGLDPARRHGLLHRGAFAALTFYDPAPGPPTAHLPAGAWDVEVQAVSRFYYALRFRVGGALP